jgi:hypothetical protein
MKLLRDLIGVILIFLAWFNSLNLSLPLRVVLFIIGFDATRLIVKVFLFLLNLFFPFLGVEGIFLVWTLLILMLIEFIFSFFKISRFLIILVKFLAVFTSIFFAMKDFQLALIIASVDLILNLKK